MVLTEEKKPNTGNAWEREWYTRNVMVEGLYEMDQQKLFWLMSIIEN
jgi:hypothetical protein